MCRLTVLIALAALGSVTQPSLADTYPSRQVKVVVPYSAGSGADISARVTVARLAKFVGGNFVIENKPGASGITGSDLVARARPDGYTLLWAPTQHAINAALIKTLPYNTLSDFIPISRLTTQPLFLGVSTKLPVNSVQELVSYIKARPGKFNYASTSIGGSIHLAGAWFAHRAALEMSHVVYSNASQAIVDLGRGEVQLIFYPYQPLLSEVQSERVRILASTGATRTNWASDVPLMAEAGMSDFIMPAWQGLFAPASTPKEIVEVLEKGLAQVTADPSYSQNLASMGTDSYYASSRGFDAFLRSEIERFQQIINVAKIKAE